MAQLLTFLLIIHVVKSSLTDKSVNKIMYNLSTQVLFQPKRKQEMHIKSKSQRNVTDSAVIQGGPKNLAQLFCTP